MNDVKDQFYWEHRWEDLWLQFWNGVQQDIDWKSLCEEAKSDLGITGWTDDWNEVVEHAKFLKEQKIEELKEEFIITVIRPEYAEYLKSERWKSLSHKALSSNNYCCKDCGAKAEQVHHLHYEHLGTDAEIQDIIPLCEACHKKRHQFMRFAPS